ncbi:hypothetical protein CLV85_1332 [Salinibacterium amurskyense]|uniref:Uncharacterized protein n=1 Tax=Salinibacterium amurskyense TaxID=205941 RepID=A0A2M9D8V5_9MICO|nr:hypothetical protein CLV85_1332 [Salinibacterium amurskyense]RLQ81918.1 hypothetical protein D9C83_06630 [Salinibacterium amurskyense]GHD78017.1 hypothetical protein GCM10007394_04900 [Salinibacterium amurskyense]
MFYVELVSEVFDASVLAAKLPGTWCVEATNFPMWLDGTRHNPEFSYETAEGDELTFADTVSYTTRDGDQKTIVGTDRLRGDEFVWRGQGWLKVLTSRWQVVGADDAFDTIVLRFSRSRLTPAGIDVLTRKGVEVPVVRTTVAHATDQFGLTAEDFASLTWLS